MAEKHYTAVIKVTKTIPEVRTTSSRQAIEREVQDIANIIVRADTLEKLVEKMGKHTALIEED